MAVAWFSDPIAAGKVCQVTYVCQFDGQIAENSVNVILTAPNGGITYLEWFDVWANTCDLYESLLTEEASVLGLIFSLWNMTTGKIAHSYRRPTPLTGTVEGTPMPRQVCGIARIEDGSAGAKGRGRIYVPFPSTTFQSAEYDGPDGAYVTSITDLITGICPPADVVSDAGGGKTVTVRGVLRHGSGPALIFTEVIRARGIDKWGTQRRRGSYGRPNANPF